MMTVPSIENLSINSITLDTNFIYNIQLPFVVDSTFDASGQVGNGNEHFWASSLQHV